MRDLYATVVSLVAAGALAGSGLAASPPAMTKLVAHASGRGSVTVAAPTKGLRTGMWLHQLAGPRSSRAKATVTCTTRTTSHSFAGTGTYFRFATTAGRWHELWRYLGEPCTVEVTVTGHGRIGLELRGR